MHRHPDSRVARRATRDRARAGIVISCLLGRRGVSALIAAAMAGAACKDATAPPTPSSVEASATTLSATAGLALTVAPTFSVKDAGGRILGGIAIAVAVTAGGGTLAGPPTSTVAGSPTPIGTWTLGQTAGLNTVTVTVGNLTPLVISLTGVAGPPASLAVTAGNSQSAFAGTTLASPLTVQLRDQFNNGVSAGTVSFAVTSGGGTITPATATTDANGNASGVLWRLGKSAIAQTVIVTSGAFSDSATANVASDFTVDLRFFGPAMPPEAAAAFNDAAARIRAAITGDIPDINIPLLTSNAGIDISDCGPTGVIVNELVDDVLIYATVVPIDGVGKILASAGPCVRRTAATGGFTIVGVMRFDVDDIAGLVSTGRLNDIVLHEMMHVVGFGTNWGGTKALLLGAGTADPRFTGPLAGGACSGAGGSVICATGVPVENCTNCPGTADAHWRESIFDTELMTGFAEAPGVAMPFSNITIQSMADEGYVVNPAAADPFLLNGGPVASRQQRSNVMTGADAQQWEIVVKPSLEISRAGIIRQLRQQ
jgi:Leishmanolysin